jgi:hypothetical protein
MLRACPGAIVRRQWRHGAASADTSAMRRESVNRCPQGRADGFSDFGWNGYDANGLHDLFPRGFPDSERQVNALSVSDCPPSVGSASIRFRQSNLATETHFLLREGKRTLHPHSLGIVFDSHRVGYEGTANRGIPPSPLFSISVHSR